MSSQYSYGYGDSRPRLAPHDRLWFLDGDIILAALSSKDTDVTVLFRVDRVVLTRNSAVLANKFSSPLNTDLIYAVHAGAPVVCMPDAAEDLESLLGAIYDPSTLPLVRRDPSIPLLVMDTMKLATKYQVPSVRALIIKHMQDDWPSTLLQWDAIQAEVRGTLSLEPLIFSIHGILGKHPVLLDCMPEPASALRLAMDYDIPSILPLVYYRLSSTSSALGWDNYLRTFAASWTRFPIRWELLVHEDWRRMSEGRPQLVKMSRKMQLMFSTTLLPLVQSCENGCPEECRERLLVWFDRYRDQVDNLLGEECKDPLQLGYEYLEVFKRHPGGVEDVCFPCWYGMQAEIQRFRLAVWNTLPMVFGFRSSR